MALRQFNPPDPEDITLARPSILRFYMYNIKMSLKTISLGLVICFCSFETEAFTVSTEYSPEPVSGVSCFLIGQNIFMEGLQADSLRNSCEKLWWCRSNGTVLESFEYDCTSLNNGSTPYFDVRTGECVESSDHCDEQAQFGQYVHPNTHREYKPSGVNETCRGWGADETYYMEIFPNLDNLSMYWQCVPHYIEEEKVFRTIAVSRPCFPGLIFSIGIDNKCSCDYPGDADNEKAIQEFNEHPANRFKCASLFNKTALEICHDEDRRFYVGRIPSNSSRRSYWECEREGETLVSKPSFRSCLAGKVFNVSSCSCSPEDDYFEYDSPDENTDRFKCATLIEECGNGEDATCYDDSGRYYLGVIPHTKECSSYYICDWNPTPGGSPLVIPKPQKCQKGLIFNVNSPFCGCDYPENSRCFANSDDKFKCASLAYTMESP